mgnify:FL=1
MINEKKKKKLGEVLAFAEVGNETITKGKASFILVMGDDEVSSILDKNRIHGDEIKKFAEENGVTEILMKKLESTGKKLRDMRDMYVGDQWDNPIELLEWSSFFHGAASAHWALVKGAGEGLNNDLLMTLSEEAQNFHHEILDTVCSELEQVGQDKAES